MVNFPEFFSGFLSRVWKTPTSGQKRRREDSVACADQRHAKALATSPLESDAKPMQVTPSPASPPKRVSQTDGNNIQSVQMAPPALSAIDFTFGGRVRELTPHRASGPQGQTGGPLISAEGSQRQQPVQQHRTSHMTQGPAVGHAQRDLAGAAAIPTGEVPVGVSNAAVRRPQPPVAQPAGPVAAAPQGGFARPSAGAPPTFGHRVDQATPEPSQGYGPSSNGNNLATPRQLFQTPGSTMKRFSNLNLGGSSTLRPPQPPGPGPSSGYAGVVPHAAPTPRVGSSGPAPHAPPGAAGPRFAQPSVGAAHQAWQPNSYLRSPYLPQPQPGPSSMGYGFPFHFTVLGRQLAQPDVTTEQLRAMVDAFMAEKARRVPVVPTREDGGFIAGDDDDAEPDNTAKVAASARAISQKLKNAVQNLRQTTNAASQPRVVAAASSGAAARASLAVSQAVAGPETMAAVHRKMEAHEQEVQRLRREAEESTQKQIAEVKTSEDAQRSRLKQQTRLQGERLRIVAQPAPQPQQQQAPPAAPAPPQQPAGRAVVPAASSSAAATRRAPPKSAARPQANPPPPADDDVVDLLSSDEEEEEEEEEEEQADGDEEDVEEEEDESQYGQYGGPYGSYGNEARGGGNRALARASAAERATWRRTMDGRAPAGEVLVAFKPNPATSIQLPREKLQCMEVGTWLNDEVINLYMLLLQARDQRMRSRPFLRCHFFNSFFYNKLFADEGAYNYANVRRWTMTKKLKTSLQDSPNVLELDRIIVPIHKGVHWTCAEIDLRAQAVRYYDSLMGEDPMLAKNLKAWVQDEALDKLQQRWDTSGWRVEFPKNIPQQGNGCDCGVFSIMFADCLGAGRPLDFTQADMNLLRVKVLHRIVDLRVD